jgi:hypothetical protein
MNIAELLNIVAIHSCDIITTKKILCLCKSSCEDLWKSKFLYEYQDTAYITFGDLGVYDQKLNSYYNYYIRKTDNFVVQVHEELGVSNHLLEYSPILEAVIDSCSNDEYYSFFQSLKIRNRFILIQDNIDHGTEQHGSYGTLEQAIITKDCLLNNLKEEYMDRNNPWIFSFIILDVSQMNVILTNQKHHGKYGMCNRDMRHLYIYKIGNNECKEL